MKYYHGEVSTDNLAFSDKRAEQLAAENADGIKLMGGTIEVGRNFGGAPAILIIGLPDDKVDPTVLIPGITFKQVGQTTYPAQEYTPIEGE